jgi:CCR4-NOT transcriptional complex subunit CAF120
METNKDTPPELLPIFTFLNSHANKLYQEGYFLRLNDLDISEPSFKIPGFGRC